MYKMTKNNQGFTLIELLAVVVIIGILSVVAVLSVTTIMENTRKDMFANTAKEYVKSAQEMWVSQDMTCGKNENRPDNVEDGEYYILIDTTNDLQNYLLEDSKSPWGSLPLKGYIRVKKAGANIKYYVALTDGIHGILDEETNLIDIEDISRVHVKMNLNNDENKGKLNSILKPLTSSKITTCSINGGNKSPEPGIAEIEGNHEIGSNIPIGTKVKIGTENFRVISSNASNNTVTLIGEYNLYVGRDYPNGKYGPEATGKQDPTMKGWQPTKPYRGIVSPSEIPKYIDNYVGILKGMGVSNITGRIITKQELEALGCYNGRACPSNRSWLGTTSYWTSTKHSSNLYWNINGKSHGLSYSNENAFNIGLRPVITISQDNFK